MKGALAGQGSSCQERSSLLARKGADLGVFGKVRSTWWPVRWQTADEVTLRRQSRSQYCEIGVFKMKIASFGLLSIGVDLRHEVEAHARRPPTRLQARGRGTRPYQGDLAMPARDEASGAAARCAPTHDRAERSSKRRVEVRHKRPGKPDECISGCRAHTFTTHNASACGVCLLLLLWDISGWVLSI